MINNNFKDTILSHNNQTIQNEHNQEMYKYVKDTFNLCDSRIIELIQKHQNFEELIIDYELVRSEIENQSCDLATHDLYLDLAWELEDEIKRVLK